MSPKAVQPSVFVSKVLLTGAAPSAVTAMAQKAPVKVATIFMVFASFLFVCICYRGVVLARNEPKPLASESIH